MRWSYNLERSRSTALWLFAVALIVVAMVVLGGTTRLTGSGLSITEWRPVTGTVPPLSQAAWLAEFHKYQAIPQYRYINAGMALADFKTLYWWEWTHRFLGRVAGLVFAIPFAVLLFPKRIPKRLIWRCWVILGLGGLQGLVGWWMVASGLQDRVSVAPERLAGHLGLALILLAACIWTGLEAWYGRARASLDPVPQWRTAAWSLFGLAFLQCLLGALVAGNSAGKVYTDWPLMNGHVFPQAYVAAGQGVWRSLMHSQAAVQFNHRLGAYLLLAAVLAFAVRAAVSRRLAAPVRALAWTAAVIVVLQAALGIFTLRLAAPLSLSLAHQTGAVIVLTTVLALAWRTQRN